MAEKILYIAHQQTKPIKIIKWKVREGTTVSIGRLLLLYNIVGAQNQEQRKLKSTQAGIVHKIVAQEDSCVKQGDILLELQACSHPTIMIDMCAECGADLRKEESISSASVPMIHAIPDLKVSEELARKLGKADTDRLIKDRKLVLLVDLDQTLIHTTNDNIPPNIKDVYHFQLNGPNSPWYHTRLRPGTHTFLNNIHDFYELHICTFGSRNYAHTIAMFLDADQKIFSNRILSRDECFDPTSKKANLKALFPCGDNMVCIIDDREDVWSHASNLIHVKPYHFFQHTGDINAPPGLDKQDNDGQGGVDFTKIKKKDFSENSKIEEISDEPVETNKIKENGTTVNCENEKDDPDIECKKAQNEDTVLQNNPITKVNGKGTAEQETEAIEIPDRPVSEGTEKSEEKLCENGPPSIPITENGGSIEEKSNENSSPEKESDSNEKRYSARKCENPDQENEAPAESPIENKDSSTETAEKNPTPNKLNIESKCILDEKTSENIVAGKDNDSRMEEDNKKIPEEIPQNKDEIVKDKESLMEIEDPDDYLYYLEEVLKRIHKHFYEEFDKMESGEVPDMKTVIPRVRNNVLKGCKLVFSGLVPTHLKLEQSKAYQVARSLGAVVTQTIDEDTTHLVAVRPGTAKVNAGRKKKKIKMVTPDWLWCCAERWEHVDERIFPLNRKGSKNRHPPPHCSSPEHFTSYPEHDTPTMRKRTPSGRFMDTINPLMSFSSDDIANMDKEVEDILDNDSDSSEDEITKKDETERTDDNMEMAELLNANSSSSSSDESLTGEYPKGYKRKREDENILEDYNSTEDDESLSVKFRRGENLDDVLDYEQDDTQDSIDPPDEVDDGEWNMMGAALEREFLANN